MSRLFACGNYVSQFLSGTPGAQYEFAEIAAGDFVKVSGNFLLAADGKLFCIGRDGDGDLPLLVNSSDTFHAQPVEAKPPPDGATWTDQFSGEVEGFTLAIDSMGRLWGMGSYVSVNGATIGGRNIALIDDTKTWVKCVVESDTALAITASGEMWTAGFNLNGQCGRGTAGSTWLAWGQVPATGWVDVALAYQTTLALMSDGGVYSCGWNFNGQCGRNSGSTTLSSFAMVSGLPGATAGNTRLLAGGRLSLVERNGALFAAGNSPFYYGGVGGNALTFVSAPTPPAPGAVLSGLKTAIYTGNVLLYVADGALRTMGIGTLAPLTGAADGSFDAYDQWFAPSLPSPVISVDGDGNAVFVLLEGDPPPPAIEPDFWMQHNLTYEIP